MMCPLCYATNMDDREHCINCGQPISFFVEDYILEDGLERWRKQRDAI